MTDPGVLVVEPLGKRHDRKAFSCGLPELDRYLARQAGQDVRRRIARVFVCTAKGRRRSARLLHAERPLDRVEFVARGTVAEAAPPPGVVRPVRPAGGRPVGARARRGTHTSRQRGQARCRCRRVRCDMRHDRGRCERRRETLLRGLRLHAAGGPADAVAPPALPCRSSRAGGMETVIPCIRCPCGQQSRMSAAILSKTGTADSRTEPSAKCAYLAVVSTRA